MAESTKALRQKIKSVESIGKITKAMEMIARAKMKQAIDNALSTRSYATLALELMINLSKGNGEQEHDLLTIPQKTEKTLVIHMASNKGLCGSFNAQMAKVLNLVVSGGGIGNIDFVTIGKKAREQVLRLGKEPILSFWETMDTPVFEDYRQLYDFVISKFTTREYKNVEMLFSNFVNVFVREQIGREILPVSVASIRNLIEHLGGLEQDIVLPDLTNTKEFSEYLYEPNAGYVLETVLPKLVAVQIFQGILESRASEESSRMVAMKSATDNSTKIRDELNIKYNRARQAGITSEIIDISLGALAVSSD
jgi:F-type H+-transporting ATPase subunit gamma